MRYYIIFGVTLIITLFILFYNPFLGVYKNQITIEYDFNVEGFSWTYDIKGEALKIVSESDNKWVFKPNKNGFSEITFVYSNGEKNKYTIYYKFKVHNNKIYWLEGNGIGLLEYPNPY